MRQMRKHILSWGTIVTRLWLVCLIIVNSMVVAQATTSTTFVTDSLTGIAINGYDPVAYFLGSKPELGKAGLEASYKGIVFRFSSQANRKIFINAPDIYAPQLGGYGLTGVARGYLSKGNPFLFEIYKNRLYLFHSVGNREVFLSDKDLIHANAVIKWRELVPQLLD